MSQKRITTRSIIAENSQVKLFQFKNCNLNLQECKCKGLNKEVTWLGLNG
jgi:hypothetical protein